MHLSAKLIPTTQATKFGCKSNMVYHPITTADSQLGIILILLMITCLIGVMMSKMSTIMGMTTYKPQYSCLKKAYIDKINNICYNHNTNLFKG